MTIFPNLGTVTDMRSRHPTLTQERVWMGHRTLGLGGGAYITRIKNAADHARHDHEEHRHQLQVAAQDAARLDVGQVLPCQAALHDDL